MDMVLAVQMALEVIGSAEEVCEMGKEWRTSGYYPPIWRDEKRKSEKHWVRGTILKGS